MTAGFHESPAPSASTGPENSVPCRCAQATSAQAQRAQIAAHSFSRTIPPVTAASSASLRPLGGSTYHRSGGVSPIGYNSATVESVPSQQAARETEHRYL